MTVVGAEASCQGGRCGKRDGKHTHSSSWLVDTEYMATQRLQDAGREGWGGGRKGRKLAGSQGQQVNRMAFEQRALTCTYGDSSILSPDPRR